MEHGWKLENGDLKYDWIKGHPLPQELTDIINSLDSDQFEDDEEEPELVNLADVIDEEDEEEDEQT